MDEIERRVVAQELTLIEVAAHIDHQHMVEAIRAIRSGFVIGITEEECMIRVAAIDMLTRRRIAAAAGRTDRLRRQKRVRTSRDRKRGAAGARARRRGRQDDGPNRADHRSKCWLHLHH